MDLKGGEAFGYFISRLLKRTFGLDSQPVVDAQTGILLVWVVIFLAISASIPMGLFMAAATVLTTNVFGLTDISLFPGAGRAFKLIAGAWIVLFDLYFLTMIRRQSAKPFDSKAILKAAVVRPAVFVGLYFAALIAIGFLRLVL